MSLIFTFHFIAPKFIIWLLGQNINIYSILWFLYLFRFSNYYIISLVPIPLGNLHPLSCKFHYGQACNMSIGAFYSIWEEIEIRFRNKAMEILVFLLRKKVPQFKNHFLKHIILSLNFHQNFKSLTTLVWTKGCENSDNIWVKYSLFRYSLNCENWMTQRMYLFS